MMKFRVLVLAGLLVLSHTIGAVAADRRGTFVAPPSSVRSRSFDQQHLRLQLKFDFDRQQIIGRATHTLVPFGPLQTIELDAAGMTVDRVLLDGKTPLTFDLKGEKLTIALGRSHGPDETVRLSIDYRITEPKKGAHFVVPDENEPGQLKMIWTQSEPETARYWFPCFDSPTDRLTSEIEATVPDGFFVLSNGTLKSKRENDDGTRTWHWVQQKSHVTYLMSVVAGQFEAYEQKWDGISITSYVPAGRLGDAARSFQKTPAMMKFFCETIDYRYPWPKYAQICVDEYVAGGMEHTSATTLNLGTLHDRRAHLDVSSDSLVAHELVHQWWGDLITCKDWAEIWLNEGFAVYFTTLWIEHDQGADEASWRRYREAESYFGEDTRRYRRPIVTYRYETPGKMFDSHSYPKAGRVLHMLRYVLGDDAFFKAIRHYCKKHAFGVVETGDLRIAVEEATGQGLNWFFDQWLYHGGHPEYRVGYEWDEAQKQLTLTVEQTQEVDDLTPLFRMPIEIDFVTAGKRTTQRIVVSKKEETFHFSLPKRPDRVCFDPRDWVLKKLTFEKSREEWLEQAVGEPNLICRVRAVRQLGEMSDDRGVLPVLAKVARDDKFWAVRQKAVEAIAKFGGEEARKTLLGVAKDDPKSFVRREAIKGLAKFSHDRTRVLLREIIKQDQSYEAVAEALRALAQVDRTGCRTDLLAALNRPSHKEVILRAAADGLAESGDPRVIDLLLPILDAPSPPRRRMAVLSALAKLGSDDAKMIEAIGRQLEDARYTVRGAACTALAETGNPAAIDLLLARRDKETSSKIIRAIDESVVKLRERQTELGKLNEKLETLEQQNRKLETRVKELEAKGD